MPPGSPKVGRTRSPGSIPRPRAVKLFPLPKERRDANLNTASFDRQGVLWFTGQNGIYGRLDPETGAMAVFDAPRGTGPYGIATTPDGQVFFASLAGNYLGQIDLETGTVAILEPPVPRQGARGSGATVAARSGSPAGTAAIFSATTANRRPGHVGTCRATGRSPTPSMSTRAMRCGSATGERTRSCASIRRPRNSTHSHCPTVMPACGSLRAARAKSEVPNRVPTSSLC
jgi:hypothetical protein